jgi:hypothetical protein
MRILLEIPGCSETSQIGGVDVFFGHLVPCLEALGSSIAFCDASQFESLQDLDRYIDARGCDVFLPLAWHEYHKRPAGYLPEHLTKSVKVWYDISLLCPFYGRHPQTNTPCQSWYLAPNRCAACHDESKYYLPPSTGYATNSRINVLLSKLPVSVPRSRIVPWAASHVPTCNLRDPKGPILVLAGKASAPKLKEVLYAVVQRFAARVILSHWTPYTQKCCELVKALAEIFPLRLIPRYELPKDLFTVFGGLSFALLLDEYYETFCLLGLA